MINLSLKEISEMVFRYSQDNQVNLLTAYNEVNRVTKNIHNFTFEEVKQCLFNLDVDKRT